ncbi:hypothetical protein GJAV_G00222660 [Gymnothorax javanicus]|nr:hypothetical protein GJAV_G00222660 [Gymnothorax javanicus]
MRVKDELEIKASWSPVNSGPMVIFTDPRCSRPIVVEEPEEESGHEVIPQVLEATQPTRKSKKWWSRISPRGIKRRFSNSVAPLNVDGPLGGANPVSASARLKKTCSGLAAALAQLLFFRCCCGELGE